MKRNRLFSIQLLLIAILAGSFASAELPPKSDLLLHCDFDGSIDATFARGDKTGICSVPPVFEEGVKGKALVIGGEVSERQKIVNGLPAQNKAGRNCCYTPEKNFDVKSGSVSFWVKPIDWAGRDPGFNVFFRTFAKPDTYFQVYKFFTGEKLLFLSGETERWTSVKTHIGEWRPGQWRHIVATWSPAESRLFVNGRLRCVRKTRFPIDETLKLEPLSVGPGGAWSKGYIGRSLVDEFRIYSRPLTFGEVGALYRQGAAGMELANGLVTIGRQTPVLDGSIAPFEYSFEGTGFSDLTGMLAVRQSNCFLSYDQENLYLALKSPIGESTTDQQTEFLLSPKGENGAPWRFVLTPDGKARSMKYGTATNETTNVEVKSVVTGGTWTLEAAIPFKLFGMDSAPDGQDWRFNISRTFAQPKETTSLAPVIGSLDDASHFLVLRFNPKAPEIRVAELFDLNLHESVIDISVKSRQPDSEIELVFTRDNTMPYGLKTRKATLFSEGRSIPHKPRPHRQLRALSDFALNEFTIQEKAEDGTFVPLYRSEIIYESQAPLRPLFFYTKDRSKFFLSAAHRAEGDVRVRFLRPDGAEAWRVTRKIPSDGTYFNMEFDLDFNKLAPGDYEVKIDYVSPTGKAIETYGQAYRIPSIDSPALRKYVDEEADKVPAPWTPVKVEGDTVETWGRQYDFKGGVPFSSLKSQGRELLASPAVLRMNGEVLKETGKPCVAVVSESPTLAVIKKSVNMNNLKVVSDINVHFDGYCAIDMTLIPETKGEKIKSLSLDVPLKGDVAKLVRDNKVSSLGGGKSGAVGDYWCQSLAKNPMLWVGDEKGGFNWLAPDLRGWRFLRVNKNVEIIRQGDVAILRFNLVDHSIKLDAPMRIQFGFTLTPTRPVDKRIMRMRLGKELQGWCQPWKYFTCPDYEDADVKRIKQRGSGYDELFLYQGDMFWSPFHPDWGFWEEEWRRLRASRGFGEWTGNLKGRKFRDAYTYTEPCFKSETYRNTLMHIRRDFYEKAKTPLTPKAINYYFDNVASAFVCENHKHGCSPYTADNGVKYGELPIDEYRELALNTYRMIRRTGPNAKIMGHQGWIRAMPMQNFADIIIGGEGVESLVANSGNYYQIFTPEFFRATFLPQIWGMKTAHLNMLVRSAAKSPRKLIAFPTDPEAQRATRHVYGYSVVHDVGVWDNHKETREVREKVWDAQDKLGWDENVVFHPYWEPDSGVTLISPKSNRILASAYDNGGRLLLAVLNDTDQEQQIKLSLDLKKLGVKPGAVGRDAFVPEKTFTLSETWEDTVPPREFRLVSWDSK